MIQMVYVTPNYQSFTTVQFYMHWPLIDPLMRQITSSFVQVRRFKPIYPQLCTLSTLHFSFLHPLFRDCFTNTTL